MNFNDRLRRDSHGQAKDPDLALILMVRNYFPNKVLNLV